MTNRVEDIKSIGVVEDIKSTNNQVGKEQVVYYVDSPLLAGQTMGLLLSLTYPETIGTLIVPRK